MKCLKTLTKTICLAGLLIVGVVYANQRTNFSQSAPPYYSIIQRDFLPHTDDWAGIVFVRPPACIPGGFNLLNVVDFQGAFSCNPLLVDGFALWKNGPPPVDSTPVKVDMRGLGAVPVWFVRWSELQNALTDNVLTVPELQSLPSLQIGSANFFQLTQQPGELRPQGLGNGKIEFVAFGQLHDGRSFQYQVREMGIDQTSVLRHVKIAFE